VAALGGTGISKSEVSRICAGLDEAVGAFRTRRLDHVAFPYVYLDATYLHVRTEHGMVVSKAVVVATDVTEQGRREILPLDVGDSEDEVFWRAFLAGLKKRGLSGVQLVISDQHAGLVAAIARALQGSSHQRCRVYFIRNVLAHVAKGEAEMVAAVIRTIFAQPDLTSMSTQWDKVTAELAAQYPKIGALMDQANAEVLAFAAFPREHWRKIWSTNPLERLNKEIKRRARVVGIFPNEAAAIRLVGAVLIDTHDEWATDERRYLSEESMAKIGTTDDNDPVALTEG
jgi:putative transposase